MKSISWRNQSIDFNAKIAENEKKNETRKTEPYRRISILERCAQMVISWLRKRNLSCSNSIAVMMFV